MQEQAVIGQGGELHVPRTDGAVSWQARGRRFRTATLRLLVGALDAAQLVAAGMLLVRVAAPGTDAPLRLPVMLEFGLFTAALAVLVRGALAGRHPPAMMLASAEAWRAASANAIAVACTGAVSALVLSQAGGMPAELPVWFGAWLVAGALGGALLRLGAGRVTERLAGGQHVILVGALDHASALARGIAASAPGTWKLDGVVDDRDPGGGQHLLALIRESPPDLVVLTLNGPDAASRIAAVCDWIADQPVRICLALDGEALGHAPRAHARIGHFALIDIFDDPHGGPAGIAKRALDLLLGGAALVALAPLLAAAAVAVRLETPGPVLFRQWRFGLGGRPIMVFKFRTMHLEGCDPSGERRTLAQDPRVTRIGRILRRTSIDELPQLVNVIRGEMSLVGPRPHPLRMRVAGADYADAVARYRVRHLVRPGITGWAQVNGSRGEVDTLEKAQRRVALDLWYLDNWSLGLDLRIMLRTALGGFASPHAD